MPMTTLEAYGTGWPVPAFWQQTKPGLFEGEDGMCKVFMDDNGDLIDPGRCEPSRGYSIRIAPNSSSRS